MNKNSSAYIVVYAVVMVVVVAAVLAVAAMTLQPIQEANVAMEQQGNILASAGLDRGLEYGEHIAERETDDGLIYYEVDGGRLYVIPVTGSGLWGPIWGYVAVEGDWNTISGVVFDHKGETPGLGAEIVGEKFTGQFVGKRLFEGDELVGITVMKGAGASAGNDHAVDAISGGTITSRAVETMIFTTLKQYEPYINAQKGK